jgi:hypothetical protein
VEGSDPIYAPYVLGTVGASQNTNTGAGVWQFNTATGTNQELISAPAAEGLHALVEHEVNFQHDNGEVHMPFSAMIGSATVSPNHVEVTSPGDDGSFDVTFTSGIDLDGLAADAFGLSQLGATVGPSSRYPFRIVVHRQADAALVSSTVTGQRARRAIPSNRGRSGPARRRRLWSAGRTGRARSRRPGCARVPR